MMEEFGKVLVSRTQLKMVLVILYTLIYIKLLSRSTFDNVYLGQIKFPAAAPLPGIQLRGNYTFVADEPFPMKPYLLRPYPGRDISGDVSKKVFNYCLSRARRTIDNSFGESGDKSFE